MSQLCGSLDRGRCKRNLGLNLKIGGFNMKI
jgi:hypothetical protein